MWPDCSFMYVKGLICVCCSAPCHPCVCLLPSLPKLWRFCPQQFYCHNFFFWSCFDRSLAAAWTLIQQPEYNFLSGVPATMVTSLRKLTIDLVLATDMKQASGGRRKLPVLQHKSPPQAQRDCFTKPTKGPNMGSAVSQSSQGS